MINRNEANYTNFGNNKTNTRISQAPGGSSSLSLGWGDSNNDYSNNQRSSNTRNNYQQQNNNNPYGQKSYQPQQQSYDEPIHVMGNNYEKANMNYRNQYEEQNTKQNYGRNNNSNNNPIGGEYGYNNYNPITQTNSYQKYPPTNKNPPKNETAQYEDPNSFYKPSNSNSYKNIQQDELDYALQQQKHKIQSSRSQRNQTNSLYQNQQSNNDTKPCVKIHQQANNDIFGNNYDYWKQDGHNTKGQNNKKQTPYLYQRNNQYSNQNRGYQQQNNNDTKTSVKVHNPPGGRTNFTFG